ERRRRAAQHAHCTGEPCPDDGQLACVVARRFRLLVARLVLLVHDDRTEVRDRREDGRARTDRDATLAAAESAPRGAALTVPVPSAGVALPTAHTAPPSRARRPASSRAW